MIARMIGRASLQINHIVVAVVLLIACAFVSKAADTADTRQPETPSELVVAAGNKVSIHYVLRLEDGEKLDETRPGEPLEFRQGASQVIVGLSEAILGMKLNERKHVTIPAAQAYGESDPHAFRPIPLTHLPEEARIPGTELASEDKDGKPMLMRVDRVEGENAIVDFNHPLAGQALVFDIEIVVIDATPRSAGFNW